MPADAARPAAGEARFAGVRARRPVECVDLAEDAATVARGGFWAVVGEFDGPVRAWRFADVVRGDGTADPGDGDAWQGPSVTGWSTSMDRPTYERAVEAVRGAVRAGDVYQANVCRVLAAPLRGGAGGEPSAQALAAVLARGNPAPFGGLVHVPASSGLPPVWVVSASPELYLRLWDGVLTSAPIKGTAPTQARLGDKDRAENVMITDLVRNDLQRVCDPGSVEVTSLLAVEHHPGLVHLVSTVQGRLTRSAASAPDRWARVLAATYPPASVSGAPKLAALGLIAALEPVPRGPYCGAVGWIDADAGRAELAVGIRTFWWTADAEVRAGAQVAPGDRAAAVSGTLRFGTGAGITWGSEPSAEWAETELKAHRLIGLASAPH
ncbi:chorismate-binding protein [uncultured Cellulomonas sp.]|uniref:chorismate-binding protein n=1 Tax=uncultured Cellulomonas sp. TaxID=189682 RepID=UPI00262524D7|nr:chorismate-binding protein [uncultured Cellulomonas sp.]